MYKHNCEESTPLKMQRSVFQFKIFHALHVEQLELKLILAEISGKT